MPFISINHLDPPCWQNAAACLYELDNTIDVWRIPVAENAAYLTRLLAPDELEKMNQYRTLASKNQFAVSRGGLRYLSGKYLQQPPEAFVRDNNTGSKPCWQNRQHAQLQFNVAHSGNYVLIAFAKQAIGIDIEKTGTQFAYNEIMHRWFNETEIRYIEAAENQRTAFYLLWTRKEALLKATAKGINNALNQFTVINGHHQVSPESIGSAHNWIVNSFSMEEAYTVSIACTPLRKKPIFWNIGQL